MRCSDGSGDESMHSGSAVLRPSARAWPAACRAGCRRGPARPAVTRPPSRGRRAPAIPTCSTWCTTLRPRLRAPPNPLHRPSRRCSGRRCLVLAGGQAFVQRPTRARLERDAKRVACLLPRDRGFVLLGYDPARAGARLDAIVGRRGNRQRARSAPGGDRYLLRRRHRPTIGSRAPEPRVGARAPRECARLLGRG
jgi:hypothetical protein